jgi:hypothetical protein
MTERPARLFELRSDSTINDITLIVLHIKSIIKSSKMEAITSKFVVSSMTRAITNILRQIPRGPWLSQWSYCYWSVQRKVS